MSARGVLLVDGVPGEAGEVPVALASPLWRAGQSLFETVLVRPDGRRGLYLAERHVDRLARAAANLRWPGCPPAAQLLAWMEEAARLFRARAAGYGRMRLTVAWTGPVDAPRTFVHVLPYTPPAGPATAAITGVAVPHGLPFPLPKSGNRLLYSLAEQEAAERGAEEGLLVDVHGRVVEGARSNLFAVCAGALVTAPEAAGVLGGITRGAVLELAAAMGAACRFETLDRAALDGADGLFLTNALWGVRPVAALDGHALAPPPPLVERLAAAYAGAARRAC